jgi:hypothetical protein
MRVCDDCGVEATAGVIDATDPTTRATNRETAAVVQLLRTPRITHSE